MADATPVPITTRAELIAFAARLDGVAEIGFDTEFHAEQTYFPKVMLLQFATPDELALVDPLAPEVKASLGGFLELIKMRGQVLVGHALENDLAIFMRLNGGLPQRIFDTQLAAALVGHGGPVGLGALLEARLGVPIDKLYSRADWGRRPLPTAQAAYALDDVRHLHALTQSLREDLEARGREAWLEEEHARALHPEAYLPRDPAEAWKRVARKPPAGTRARAVLEAVAAERERIAQETDKPPRRVLPDDLLVDLARRAPREASKLDADTNRRSAPSLGKHANRWLTAIEIGLEAALPADDEASTADPDADMAVRLGKLLVDWVLERAAVSPWLVSGLETGLRSLVVKPPADATELRSRLGLEGWRGELLTEPLWSLFGEGRRLGLASRDERLVVDLS